MVQLAAGAFQFSRKLAVVAQLLDEQIVEQPKASYVLLVSTCILNNRFTFVNLFV